MEGYLCVQSECLQVFPDTNDEDVRTSAMECWDDVTAEAPYKMPCPKSMQQPMQALVKHKGSYSYLHLQVRASYAAKHTAEQLEYDEKMENISLA